MLKDHLRIALRTLLRYKVYSIQNIVGLSLALAISIIGLLYITKELSYEKHYANADRIYRINTDFRLSEQFNQSALTPDAMGALWQQQFQEVESFARIFVTSGFRTQKDGQQIREGSVVFADSSLFRMFNLKFISKAVGFSLAEPNSMVITSSMAKKYFGRTDVAGLVLEVDEFFYAVENKKPCKIAGVIEDFPENTQLKFDFFFPIKDFEYGWNRSFAAINFNTFVLLKDGTDHQKLNARFAGITAKEIYPNVTKSRHLPTIPWEQFVKNGNVLSYELFPLTQIHLAPEREGQLIAPGSKLAVQILTMLILFTILMATVNFINLSTAMAMRRAKQIGILKVLGSSRRSLINKLLIEAFLLVACSAIIAAFLTVTILPFANLVLGIELQTSDLKSLPIVLIIIGLVIVNTLLSGLYPAFYLSGLNPIESLQGGKGIKPGGENLRKALTLLQFVVAICLISGTVVIYSQLQYLKKVGIGYEREQVYIIDNISVLGKNKEAFQNEVKSQPGVMEFSLGNAIPVNFPKMNQVTYSTNPADELKRGIPMHSQFVDDKFLAALDIKLESGANFNSYNNFRKIIINQAAADAFGLDDPINKKIYAGDTLGSTIVGMIRNYHFESLRESVSPLILYYAPGSNASYGNIRFAKNTNLAEQLRMINMVWKRFANAEPVSGYFLDDAFNNSFKADETIARATVWVASITIGICCIGLFGLITFITSVKKKEIGVRKVLGASPASIVRLLSRHFVVLVFIAFLIATPIVWWAMHSWLQGFVYRVNISLWMICLGLIITALITIATVGYQAMRAAIVNPVEGLKEN